MSEEEDEVDARAEGPGESSEASSERPVSEPGPASAPPPEAPAQPPAPETPLDRGCAAHYESLRDLARLTVRGRFGQPILDPTELVNETYLRLTGHAERAPQRRTEFLALAATVIRNVLVDHARELQTLKRGGSLRRLTLDGRTLSSKPELDVLELDEALSKLGRLDARQARIVELKFFGGLSIEEVAHLLGVSPRTVDSDWSLARAWLHRELTR